MFGIDQTISCKIRDSTLGSAVHPASYSIGTGRVPEGLG